MTDPAESGGLPRLIRRSDGREFPLSARLTTIGSAPQCRIFLSGNAIPPHVAHIMFSEGSFSVAVVSRTPAARLNNSPLVNQSLLSDGDILTIGSESYLFAGGIPASTATGSSEASPLHRFIAALSRLTRRPDGDARTELLAAVAQLLSSDAARLVIEENEDHFVTIARYPDGSDLERFSQRAIHWARQQGNTVLMHDTDWESSRDSKGSLELNDIGSILCRPLFEGETVRGYLYLDKKQKKAVFTPQDRSLLDEIGPLFGDLLALYERANRQRETIALLQAGLEHHESPIIFSCESMRHAIERASTFAATDSTVLITGETGTGKELFARFVHRHSNRRDRDFCAINCGALPENLIESELFGHEKGAFTGAHQRKAGLFERARGGTVFLDEIGEVPLNLQVKLLRVLQESEMVPVGATATVSVDVRIIAATNRTLAEEVARSNFREDLFYRINVLEVAVPPLRHRNRDTALLADFFIRKYAARFGIQEKGLSLPAQAQLLGYPWPGNIRQLENVIQKALLVAKGSLITETDIDLPDASRGTVPHEQTDLSTDTAVPTLKEARTAAERKAITDALKRSDGNVSIAARLLDTDRKWLTKLMKLHNIRSSG